MKTQIILGIALLAAVSLKAQQPGHYLHFNIGGGLNNLSYTLQNGTQKGQFGYTVNGAYSYFFTPHFGLQTGVGIQSFNGSSILNVSTTSPATDTDGDAYELGTAYLDWQEKQQTLFVEIPLLAQYRFTLGQKLRLIASAGAKVSIPVNTTYKTTAGQIVTTGFYPQWNVDLSEMPQHGFGTNANQYTGSYTLKTAYMAIADIGGLIKLSEKKDLYLGGYFNYGLNNVLTPDNQSISEQDGTYNGVFVSSQVNEVLPVAFGIKVGLYLKLGKKTVIPTPAKSAEAIQFKEPVIVKEDAPAANENQKPAIAEQAAPAAIDDKVQAEQALESAQKTAASYTFNFGLDSNQPLAAQKQNAQALKDILAANPDLTLYLVGHTCDLGSHELNLRIGQNRADAVKQILVKDGVPEVKMKAITKAYDEPLLPNTSEENRAKNRRVEIQVMKDGK